MVSIVSPAGAMPAPPTSIQQRPKLGMKRDSSYIDPDNEIGLSASTKKLRFDDNVDIRIMDDWNEKSLELVREEVRIALDRHVMHGAAADDTQYAALVQFLGQDIESSEAPTPKLLKKYLVALGARVKQLGECGKLVMAILDLEWLGRDEQFVALYARLLASLASSCSKYVLPMMEKLVANFSQLSVEQGELPGEALISRSQMLARLHLVIKSLVRQIPSASAALHRALVREHPNSQAASKSYMRYQKHLLHLARQLPELKTQLLALVTEQLVEVDVQIQEDLEDFQEDAEERLLQRRGAKDRPNAEDSDDEADEEDEADETAPSTEAFADEEEQLRQKIDKMDGTMDQLFEYYAPLIENGVPPEINEGYQQLLSHFTKFILPRRTRHAQFLVFHFSQHSPEHISTFAERCLNIAFDKAATGTAQNTACAYLASFIARGAHIPSNSVKEVVEILCHSLNDMWSRLGSRAPDRRTYNLYYAIAQSLLYIFCFRWRDLVKGTAGSQSDPDYESEDDVLAEGRDLTWMEGLKETFVQNISCRLNPLKICSTAIVHEFARIAHHLRFVYVYSILESNKRVRLNQAFSFYGSGIGDLDVGRRQTAWDHKSGEAHHQLEAYFPFDPYHLPKSKRWVGGDYNEWKLPAGMVQVEDDQDDDLDESDSEYDSEDDDLPQDVELASSVSS